MKALLEQRATNPRAAMAVEMFTYQVRKSIGALAAALGGIDTLVFTGGIGEHAAPVRAECCAGLEHLGIRVDSARNAASAERISADESACAVLVVPTDEELMIARHTRRLVFPPEPMNYFLSPGSREGGALCVDGVRGVGAAGELGCCAGLHERAASLLGNFRIQVFLRRLLAGRRGLDGLLAQLFREIIARGARDERFSVLPLTRRRIALTAQRQLVFHTTSRHAPGLRRKFTRAALVRRHFLLLAAGHGLWDCGFLSPLLGTGPTLLGHENLPERSDLS